MAYFVPDFWHKQAVDLAGPRGCVKTLDFWHRAGVFADARVSVELALLPKRDNY
jgi:hypothetical protein